MSGRAIRSETRTANRAYSSHRTFSGGILPALFLAAALLVLAGLAGCSSGGGSRADSDAAGEPEGAAGTEAPAPAGDSESSSAITAGELDAHVSHLASDELAGREVGTPGARAAEEYIADVFETAGLSPIQGENDFFLDFTVFEHGYDPQATSLILSAPSSPASPSSGRDGGRRSAGDSQMRGTLEEDFRPFHFSDQGRQEAPVVFAGYGITAPEHDYDDYEGLDVEGKIVLILRHEPNEEDPESPFDGTEWSRHAYFTTKAENAAAHGAVGMILVTDPLHHSGPEDFRIHRDLSLSSDGETIEDRRSDEIPAPGFVAVHASQPFVRSAVSSWPQSLERIQRRLDRGVRPAGMNLPALHGVVSVERRERGRTIAARNVVGTLEAGGPDAPWIVLGAHHDHLGAYQGAGDTIFNGADDNASGTALVLEVAEHFGLTAREAAGETNERGSNAGDAAPPDPSRYNYAFVTFSAEEQGLLGSKWLAESDVLGAEQVELIVVADMVGRNPDEPVNVYGTPELTSVLTQAESSAPLDYRFHGEDLSGYSDFYPYSSQGSRFVFVTTGLHDDYHQPSDEAPLLDYDHIASLSRWVAELLRRAAGDGSETA